MQFTPNGRHGYVAGTSPVDDQPRIHPIRVVPEFDGQPVNVKRDHVRRANAAKNPDPQHLICRPGGHSDFDLERFPLIVENRSVLDERNRVYG